MRNMLSRRALLSGSAVAATSATITRRGRAADKPIRIGVLTDMAGPYAANTGLGSVLGAQMAVEDFMRNTYTNQPLSSWMISKISAVYCQAYSPAYDLAKKAEKAYRYELGLSSSSFINLG